jgi:hypothetical protein
MEGATDSAVTLALIGLGVVAVNGVVQVVLAIISNQRANTAISKIDDSHVELKEMHTAVNSNTKSAEAREAALTAKLAERDKQITDLMVQRAKSPPDQGLTK